VDNSKTPSVLPSGIGLSKVAQKEALLDDVLVWLKNLSTSYQQVINNFKNL
jgi:hypothetical protein